MLWTYGFPFPGERRAGAGPDARGHGAVLCPGQVGQPTISAAEGRREQDGVRKVSDVIVRCLAVVSLVRFYFPPRVEKSRNILFNAH